MNLVFKQDWTLFNFKIIIWNNYLNSSKCFDTKALEGVGSKSPASVNFELKNKNKFVKKKVLMFLNIFYKIIIYDFKFIKI